MTQQRAAPGLADALQRHRSGDLAGAAAGYEAILRAEPEQADALHLLGLVAHARGEPERALALIGRAVARAPSPRHLANWAMVLAAAGRFAEAEPICRQALALRPDYPEALNTLGVALAGLQRPEPAEQAYRQALALRPDYAEAELNLARVLAALWRYREAEAAFRRGFALRPALNPPRAAAAPARRRILFVIGDADMPGGTYRGLRMAASAAEAGWDARCIRLAALDEALLPGLDVLLFWRIELDARLCALVAFARAGGTAIGLDVDDLIVDPALARLEVIDGIRTIGASEAELRQHFTRIRQMLDAVDFATCTTPELARHVRAAQKPVWVLPNGFDHATDRAASRARRARRRAPEDGLLRIGYAGGTRTHQRDLAVAAAALARVLAARPAARLVLFRNAADGVGLVFLDEFPELAARAAQVEWRDMVPLDALPAELARFDVNIAPLEAGNPFVEAKSELKYFEAALVGVPTVASPTGPFRRAIRPDETGLLADGPEAWEACLLRLLDDPPARARLGQAARHDALWQFGPARRARLLGATLDQVAGDGPGGFAPAAALPARAPALPQVPAIETLFESDDGGDSRVCVSLAAYDYARFMAEALDSVAAQTLPDLDLVVVDDGSADESVPLALAWAERHRARFHRLGVLRTRRNAGLGGNRNAGFAWAETPFVLPLDADNRLRPDCIAALLAAATTAGAAFAYPSIQRFGADQSVLHAAPFQPQRLVGGNVIDAMALVAQWAWAAAGGYYVDRSAMGWEDYDLWCRFAELGLRGAAVDRVLAEYRVHAGAMSDALVETAQAKPALVALLERRHPWLDILARTPRPRR